jgi:hypothetical protein
MYPFQGSVGLLLAAAFPLREDAAGVTYDPGGHFIAGVTFFLSTSLAMLALSRRLATLCGSDSASGHPAGHVPMPYRAGHSAAQQEKVSAPRSGWRPGPWRA